MKIPVAFLATTIGVVVQYSYAGEPMFSGQMQQCIVPAAQYHGVNPNIVWAILKVESNFKPDTVTKNENKTNDFGMGGMNSIHMPNLAKHGVTPENIKDPCIATYVTSWHLRKEIERHGNTWFGVAAYHSVTPYFNKRYQILLRNALIRAGAIQGNIEKVPPLKPTNKSKQANSQHITTKKPEQESMVVADF